jgi:hypothetical protein
MSTFSFRGAVAASRSRFRQARFSGRRIPSLHNPYAGGATSQSILDPVPAQDAGLNNPRR